MKADDLKACPFEQFGEWFGRAKETEMSDPNAMSLATATKSAIPSVRIVLLKEWDNDGFVFYTNLTSRKGQELQNNPKAALCFYWKSLNKQVRIEGRVHQVSDERADAYYHSRPRRSQIGAWASKQSQVLEKREILEQKVNALEDQFKDEDVIPRPEFWSGFLVKPTRFEFWASGDNRLHDRFIYELDQSTKQNGWSIQRHYP